MDKEEHLVKRDISESPLKEDIVKADAIEESILNSTECTLCTAVYTIYLYIFYDPTHNNKSQLVISFSRHNW